MNLYGFWFSLLVSFDQYYQFPNHLHALLAEIHGLVARVRNVVRLGTKANASLIPSFLITLAAIKVFPV